MRHNTVREIVLATFLTAAIFSPAWLVRVRAQTPAGGFPDLVAALNATPGCLGVETARTASGKQVIFAWFDDKKAALSWYYSDTHTALMNQFFPQRSPRTPMVDVPDDGGPVVMVASITYADKAPAGVTTLPVSQLAIELYRPLPGGVALGGRFAPASLKVPGLIDVALPAPNPGGQVAR
jgi:hypothetical protein